MTKVLCALLLATAPLAYVSAYGCGGSQHGEAIVGNLINCAKVDRGALLGLVTELGVAAVRDATTDQAVNWKALGLKAAAQGVTLGGCAFAQFVRGFVQSEAPPIAEGTVARSLLAEPNPAVVELEALRAQWGGVRWSVEVQP